MQLPLITTCGRKKEPMKEREVSDKAKERVHNSSTFNESCWENFTEATKQKNPLCQSSTEFKLMHHFMNAALRCPISLKQMTVVAQ